MGIVAKKEEDAINATLSKLALISRAKGIHFQTNIYNLQSGGIMLSLEAKASGMTEARMIQSRSRELLTGKIIAFINDRHNEILVINALGGWELELEDVVVVRTDACTDAGLEKLLETVEDGNAVFISTIADFITDNDLSTIIRVLDELEERNALLISHLELGCSYEELRMRVKAAKVLTDSLDGDNLYKYRYE